MKDKMKTEFTEIFVSGKDSCGPSYRTNSCSFSLMLPSIPATHFLMALEKVYLYLFLVVEEFSWGFLTISSSRIEQQKE